MKIVKFFFFICLVCFTGALFCNLILIYKIIGEINPPIIYNRVVIKEVKQLNCNKNLEFRVIDREGIVFSQKISNPQKFEIVTY